MRSSLDLSTTWWRVAYPHLSNGTAQLKVDISEHQSKKKRGIRHMIHTWLWHFSQGSEEYPFQRANRKDFWSPGGKERRRKKPSLSKTLTYNKPATLRYNRSELLPGTADRSTPPALVLKGRRGHQEPAAASCISLAKPQSASRWHSRRHADKWHYLHHHSAPSTRSGNTCL